MSFPCSCVCRDLTVAPRHPSSAKGISYHNGSLFIVNPVTVRRTRRVLYLFLLPRQKANGGPGHRIQWIPFGQVGLVPTPGSVCELKGRAVFSPSLASVHLWLRVAHLSERQHDRNLLHVQSVSVFEKKKKYEATVCFFSFCNLLQWWEERQTCCAERGR